MRSEHGFPSFWRTAVLIGVIFCSTAIVFPQSDPTGGAGVKAYGVYHGSSIEQISLETSKLILDIPLVSYPQRGGKLHVDYVLHYHNPVYSYQSICNSMLKPCLKTFTADAPAHVFAALEGFPGLLSTALPSPNSSYPDLTIIDSAGGYHQAAPINSATGQVVRAIDATGWWYNGNTYTFIDPNGVRLIGNSTGSQTIAEDSNGNEITVSGTSIVDTLGRNIPQLVGGQGGPSGPTTTSDYSGCTGPRSIQSASIWTIPAASGGTVTYKFCFVSVHVQINAFPTACFTGYQCDAPNTNYSMLQSIVLPNGTAWEFEWNGGTNPNDSTVNAGLISKITLPTGGTVAYTWNVPPEHSNVPSYLPAVTSRTMDAQDGTGPKTWTYTPTFNGTNMTHVVVDPLGNNEVHTLTGLGSCTNGLYDTQVQYYQGTASSANLLKTVATAYSYISNPYPGTLHPGQCGITGVVPTSSTTTWPNGQVSQETKSYDSGFGFYPPGATTTSPAIYGKVVSDSFYDYGQNAPGAVLKTINNSWLALTNSNYLSGNMLSLLASQQTVDSSGTQQAYVTYGYDAGSLLSSGVTTQFTSPPNGAYRGNQTTINHWLSTNNTYLTTTNTFYDTGILGKAADPANDATQYSYSSTYDGAYLTSIQDALNHTTTFTYDFNTGEMLTKKDANSQTTSYSYDNMRRLATVSFPDGGKTTYTYSETAAPFSVTTTDAITSTVNKTEVEYIDGFGRETRSALTSDPEGTVYVDTTYDVLGRKSTITNPYRATSDPTYGVTTYQYDGLGRVTLEIPPDGSSTSNNVSTSYSGGCSTVTDQAGKQKTICNDALDRPVQVFEAPNSLNFETDYQYDTIGDLKQITQKGNAPNTSSSWRTRTGTYDSLGRLSNATSPETGTTTWTYDVDSNVTGKTDARNITITYGYDALHRITSKTYSNSDPSVTYNYDQSSANGVTITNGIGRETSMSDASGNTTWSYDSVGRSLLEQRTISASGITSSAITKTAKFQYNLDGSTASVTYPSNRVVNLAYDAAGNAISAIDGASSFKYVSNVTYAPHDAFSGMNLGATSTSSGIVLTDTYNNRLQPATLTATSPSASLLSRTYSFNSGTSSTINNGTLVKITNNLVTARSQNFTYDDLNRLTSAYSDGSNWGDTYTVDSWGNLTNKTPMSGKTQAENFQQSVLATNQLSGYGYDANGNMTSDGSLTYAYDAENRIKSAAGVSYVYNGDGERVGKSGGTLYWHGSDKDALSESDTAGNITNDFIFFGGKRIARVLANGTVYFYIADHLGSATVIASSSGTKLSESDYYPYGGEMVITADSTANHYKFNGKERDAETGLDYFSARHYSPAMGRFMTADWSATPTIAPYARLGSPQTLNLYGYVENNPITGTDPDGHEDHQIPQNGTSCYAGSGQCGGCSGFFSCLSNAVVSDNLLGVGRQDATTTSGTFGQIVGDGIAAIQGTVQTAVGGTVAAGGVAACGTGVGCAAGAPAIAVGSVAAVQGAGTLSVATVHLLSDVKTAEQRPAGESKSTTPAGKSSSGQNINAHGEKLGPSGRPVRHGTDFSTRKAAKDAARQAGKSGPALDKGHFHPTDREGNRLPNAGHYNFPE